MSQQQQTGSQTPPNQQPQVPDHRLDEVMQKMKVMELQNTQLRAQIDFMANQGRQGQPQKPAESPFKPEVQQAIEEIVSQRVNAVQQATQQKMGMLYDQLDQVNYQAKYGGDKFAKLHPKVEQLRQEYQARNQYITREDALRMVHFEENGTKAQPNPAPQSQTAAPPPPPVFDPYFGQYVDPVTGKPFTAPVEAEAPVNMQPPWQQPAPQAPPPAQTQQTWQGQQQQPPQQQWQGQQVQAPATGTQYPGQRGPSTPQGNAYGQTFQLPNQGVNQVAPPTHQGQGNARAALSLESSDADLAAFESQFGDIPL